MTDEKVITTEQDIPAETLENLSNNKGVLQIKVKP